MDQGSYEIDLVFYESPFSTVGKQEIRILNNETIVGKRFILEAPTDEFELVIKNNHDVSRSMHLFEVWEGTKKRSAQLLGTANTTLDEMLSKLNNISHTITDQFANTNVDLLADHVIDVTGEASIGVGTSYQYTIHNTPLIDVRRYPERLIEITNDANEEVYLSYVYLLGYLGEFDSSKDYARHRPGDMYIPAGESRVFSNKENWGQDDPAVGLFLWLYNTNAAASGNVKVKIWGFSWSRQREIIVADQVSRSKHNIIFAKRITAPANDNGRIGFAEDTKYYVTMDGVTPIINVSDFSFIYFKWQMVDSSSDNPMAIKFHFETRDIASASGIHIPEQGSSSFPNFSGELNITPISGTAKRLQSDWIQVIGTSLRHVRLENNDDVERSVDIAIIGIR